jgi:hypothetical protein
MRFPENETAVNGPGTRRLATDEQLAVWKHESVRHKNARRHCGCMHLASAASAVPKKQQGTIWLDSISVRRRAVNEARDHDEAWQRYVAR